jgi:thermitase
MRHVLFRCCALLVALLILFCSAAPARVAWAQEDLGDYVPGEVLVKLNQAGDLTTLLAEYNLTLDDQFGTRSIYLLNIGDGMSPPDKAVALQSDSRVAAAEPNFIGQTPEGDARTPWAKGGTADDYAAQWAPAKIRLPQAHARTRGRNVTVAVLDTGIDRTHPVFEKTVVLPGFDFVDFDGVPDEVGSQEQNIVYGHGTHVAGLVALAAPDTRLMPVRVLDEDGVGNIWVLIEGLQYAINNGADVINLSFSFARESNILTEIVAEITVEGACDDDDDDRDRDEDDEDDDDGDDRDEDDDDCDDDDNNSSAADCDPTGFCVRPGGVVIVAAAGNRGSITPEYPAAERVSELLAVAASTEADTLAIFSNRGAWVDLAAPGERILSSVPGGEYGTWSGTSMAAPLVAGVAALVRARNSSLTAAQVAGRIVRAAVRVCGQDAPRLDAAAAVAGRLARPGSCVAGLPPVTRTSADGY